MSDFLDEKIDLFLEQLPHKERSDRIVRENFYRIKQYCDKLRYTINNLYVCAPEDPVYALLTAEYNITDVWANVPGLSLTIPSDGLYDLKFEAGVYIRDINGSIEYCHIAIGSDSINITDTLRRAYHRDGAINKAVMLPCSVSITKQCVKNEVITARALEAAGDDCVVRCNANEKGYIMYRKLGHTLEGI